jgi:uncharacterized protein (TIGR00369 family)
MENADRHFRELERIYSTAPINAYYRPVLTVSDRMSVVEIEVRPEFFHAAAAVHGSVYFKALDDAAYFAVNSVVTDVFVLTVTFNIYLTRPVSEGVMRATGRLVSESKSLYVAESDLVDGRGRTIARGSGSFMRSAIPLEGR